LHDFLFISTEIEKLKSWSTYCWYPIQ